MASSPKPKFCVDAMLGKLARYLRLLGYDTLYFKDVEDEEILSKCLEETRTVVSRDRGLCKKAIDLNIPIVCFNRSMSTSRLLSCLKDIGLIELNFDPVSSRCPLCNGELVPTQNPPISYGYKRERTYYVCKNCGMIYWVGRHMSTIKRTLGEARVESC
ncbi:MAG: hypothetical protein GU347_00655 [Desulfurococcales archaeon]|nr:hypothetical protein [Desulfurococcales archaeon]